MKDSDGQDECKEEPVGHVNVRLFPPHDRAEIDEEVSDPDDSEPDVDIPFRLGIFLGLGDAKEIAGAGDGDEKIRVLPSRADFLGGIVARA